MRAISIRQPWAWLIVRPDIADQLARAVAAKAGALKGHENRDWPTKIRGRVLVHAAKGMTHKEYERVEEFLRSPAMVAFGIKLPKFYALERGGIVGSVVIADCVSASDSPWFFGKYGFVLHDAKPLPFYPTKGRLGFFDAGTHPALGE